MTIFQIYAITGNQHLSTLQCFHFENKIKLTSKKTKNYKTYTTSPQKKLLKKKRKEKPIFFSSFYYEALEQVGN
jgi:hypothetical protein